VGHRNGLGALTVARHGVRTVAAGVAGIALLTGATGCTGSGSTAKGSSVSTDARRGSSRADFDVPTTVTLPTTTLTTLKVGAAPLPEGYVKVDRPADGYSVALPSGWNVVASPTDLDALLGLPGAKKSAGLLEAFRSLLSVRNAVVAVDREALAERVGPFLSIASQPASPTDPAQLDGQLRDRALFEGGTSPVLIALDIAGVAGRRLTYQQTTAAGVRYTQQYVLVTEEHLVSMSFSTDDIDRDGPVFEKIVATFVPAA
jgi:hypothetical protein